MNITALLERLIGFLAEQKIDFALIGAFALQAYGYVRATQDMDFVVREEGQERVIGFLESLGYQTLYRSKGFSNHLHPLTSLGRIDLVYVAGETADAIFSGTRQIPILDVSVPVARPEHLVALKIFAMKNDPARSFREMADIQQLLKHTEIDMDEIRGYFEKYGQMEKFYELTRKG
ncbi:MAG TPA: nucleotidyltransferase family protein [Syntrophobacteraceae bacterium]|nr:nucleotidyltransferase family protein [Syntrophobacteraceae bacterium]